MTLKPTFACTMVSSIFQGVISSKGVSDASKKQIHFQKPRGLQVSPLENSLVCSQQELKTMCCAYRSCKHDLSTNVQQGPLERVLLSAGGNEALA